MANKQSRRNESFTDPRQYPELSSVFSNNIIPIYFYRNIALYETRVNERHLEMATPNFKVKKPLGISAKKINYKSNGMIGLNYNRSKINNPVKLAN